MQETPVQSPRLGRSPGEGNGHPLQYSGLENSMDCIVYGVAKSQTQVSDFHFCSERLFSLPLNDSGEVNVELPFWNENMTIKDLLKMLRAGS